MNNVERMRERMCRGGTEREMVEQMKVKKNFIRERERERK